MHGDRDFRVGDPDVNMHREGRLAAGEFPHRPVDELVALAGRNHDFLPDGEGVGAGGGGAKAQGLEGRGEAMSQSGDLSDCLGHIRLDVGPQLDRRTVGLGRHVSGDFGRQPGEDRIDPVGERVALRRDQHHFFLDPDRELPQRMGLLGPGCPGGSRSAVGVQRDSVTSGTRSDENPPAAITN